VGARDKRVREDRKDRALLYNIIKGWADPKSFTKSMERFWPLEGDSIIDIIMPTHEELISFDQRFRSIGNKKKWLE